MFGNLVLVNRLYLHFIPGDELEIVGGCDVVGAFHLLVHDDGVAAHGRVDQRHD